MDDTMGLLVCAGLIVLALIIKDLLEIKPKEEENDEF